MRQRQPERPRGLLVDVWAVSQLVEGLVDRKLEAAGIDPYGWGTLSVIGAFGPLTPSDVALADRPPAHDAARAPPLRSLWIVRGIGVWRVDPARRPWREVVAAPISKLSNGSYALDVHRAAGDASYVACANLR